MMRKNSGYFVSLFVLYNPLTKIFDTIQRGHNFIVLVQYTLYAYNYLHCLISQMLHRNIDSFEKKLSGSSGTLTLKCKDFSIMHLEIPSIEDCLNVASSIDQLSNVGQCIPFMVFATLLMNVFQITSTCLIHTSTAPSLTSLRMVVKHIRLNRNSIA
jgi:hypothetical protein